MTIELERYQDRLTIQRVLLHAKTIAVVGLSNNELRASHFVGYYLKRHGYRVIPVNPREVEILGERSFKSLLDVPVPVDVVNVFRAPEALPAGTRLEPRRAARARWTRSATPSWAASRLWPWCGTRSPGSPLAAVPASVSWFGRSSPAVLSPSQ